MNNADTQSQGLSLSPKKPPVVTVIPAGARAREITMSGDDKQ